MSTQPTGLPHAQSSSVFTVGYLNINIVHGNKTTKVSDTFSSRNAKHSGLSYSFLVGHRQ